MKITKNITPKQIQELLAFAQNDPETLKYTNDKKRFSSLYNFNKWAKTRIIYTAVGKKESLLGIIWFSKNEYGIAFAIRMYPPARGHGLAHYFMNDVIKDFLMSKDYENMGSGTLMLETKSDNTTAIDLYTKNGWTEVKERNGKKTFVYDN
jgi:GNAT superfamily N-acetyltransferase